MTAELLERIEDYLAGDLDYAALSQYAREAGVADLDREIQWLQDSQTAVAASALRRQLRTALPAAESAPVRRLAPRRTWLAIAASLLILVAAGLWWFNQPTTPDLYAAYEYVDPGLPVLMSQSTEYELYDALTYYGEGNYTVAAEKLQALAGTPLASDTVHYYLGASLLYQGQAEAAQEQFARILAGNDPEYIPRAQWLSVLAALRSEDFDAARRRLAPILNTSGHPFAAEARSLAAEWE